MKKSEGINCINGKTTKVTMALVQLCYETLLEDGKAAVLAVQAHICTKALENIIKDNTYLSRVVLDLNLED